MSRRANHGTRHRGAYSRSYGQDGVYIEICSCGVERLAEAVGPSLRTRGLTSWMDRGKMRREETDLRVVVAKALGKS